MEKSMGKFWTAVALCVLALRPATAEPLPPMLEEAGYSDEMVWEGEEGYEEPLDLGEEIIQDDFTIQFDLPVDDTWMEEVYLDDFSDLPPFDEMFPPTGDEELMYFTTVSGPGGEPEMSHNPEPSSLVLGGLGCLSLLGHGWRSWRARKRS
jgi:hypothetical protein